MSNAARGILAGPLALLIIVAYHVPLFADPGFGILRRRTIDLQVRRPALVRLANTSIAFKSAASDPQYRPLLASLEATLETELVSNERTLVKRPLGDAEWVVELTVTGFSAPAATKRVERVKNSTTTYVRWTGTANVAYQVVDRGGRVHDADNVSYTYDNEVVETPAATPPAGLRLPAFLTGGDASVTVPRSVEDVKQILINAVVQQIAANLGNTVQVIQAQVAGGDPTLDRAADFMTKQLWARAIEELEKKAAFAKPEDESYRLYSLGLAYEAMSYDSKTFNDQRANLFKAQEYYDKALEINTGQRYFVDVVARTRESVARYRTLEAAAKEDRAKQAPTVTATARTQVPAATPNSAEATASKALTVSDVIEMHTAGVPTGDIIQLIERSALEFQLNRETALAVANAKLPVPIQNAMRRKAGLEPLPDANQGRTPAKPAPSSTK